MTDKNETQTCAAVLCNTVFSCDVDGPEAIYKVYKLESVERDTLQVDLEEKVRDALLTRVAG